MEIRDHQILKEFSANVRQQFPDAQIWAFGSRARGNAQFESSPYKASPLVHSILAEGIAA
ncbi:MAG: hypothetical protein ACHWZW_14735 [Spirulina sp.]